MKKIIKTFLIFSVAIGVLFSVCACSLGQSKSATKEKVELTSAVISEVEFENADSVSLEQKNQNIKVTGSIDAMSTSQKNIYGVQDVTHVVVLKLTFDKEKTLEGFVLKGSKTKVFGADSSVENYAGNLTTLLDNESGEDAYTNLVLSANTKTYELTVKYSDQSEVKLNVTIDATLVTAD